MEQWDFYVIATYLLDKNHEDQKTISLGSLKKMSEALKYGELQNAIIDRFKM